MTHSNQLPYYAQQPNKANQFRLPSKPKGCRLRLIPTERLHCTPERVILLQVQAKPTENYLNVQLDVRPAVYYKQIRFSHNKERTSLLLLLLVGRNAF